MALYLVRAKPRNELADLRKEMDSGKISKLEKRCRTVWIMQESMTNMDMHYGWRKTIVLHH